MLEKIHDVLRWAVRKEAGKEETPTAGSIDSQSVETTQKKGGHRGYDPELPQGRLQVRRQKVENVTSW